jgi:hypothetical protein
VILSQTGARLRSERHIVSRAVHGAGDVALARDVLDRQLVDVAGVQVVRVSEVYLLNRPHGWELAGVDVGVRSLTRRLLPPPRRCPPADRAIHWADLHAFVPRFTDTTSAWESAPAAAAGLAGSGIQLGSSATELKRRRAAEVAAILARLPRTARAQPNLMLSAAAEALTQLDAEHREALLGQIDGPSRARLRGLLDQDDR